MFSCLNNLHSSIKFIVEKVETMVNEKIETLHELNFLDVLVIFIKQNTTIITDIYCKIQTHMIIYNTQMHTFCKKNKNNVPYNLAKRIRVVCYRATYDTLFL